MYFTIVGQQATVMYSTYRRKRTVVKGQPDSLWRKATYTTSLRRFFILPTLLSL